MSGGRNRAITAHKLDPETGLHLFGFAQQHRPNLPGAMHVGASAGSQVEVANINEPQLFPFQRRQLRTPRASASSKLTPRT